MYETYYGFREKPFNIAPDPDFLYLSPKHRNAISSLDFGLMEESGIILFTGDIGTGKTTIIRHMLKKIGNEFIVAVVDNTNVDGDQLLGHILHGFGLMYHTDNKAATLEELTRFLSKMRAGKARPLLIIDEGQCLSHGALEEVRLLSNLQEGNKALLQIMLVGQPELNAKLNAPSMAALSQRVTVNYHLKPFDREETGHYIVHRLTTAGGHPSLFTDAAIDLVHRTTGGIPRAINIISHAALVYGFADDKTRIDTPVLEEILQDSENSGLGIDRWMKQESGGKVVLQAEEFTEHTPGPVATGAATGSPAGHEGLETRIERIESQLAEYTNELRNFLKALLIKERNRSDRLLAAYTKLKTQFDALQGRLADDVDADDSRDEPAGEPDAVNPPRGSKTLSLVLEPKNRAGKD
jgi:type II secretory pathway predicted ATPase ExeA